jgi:hypothetical protein
MCRALSQEQERVGTHTTKDKRSHGRRRPYGMAFEMGESSNDIDNSTVPDTLYFSAHTTSPPLGFFLRKSLVSQKYEIAMEQPAGCRTYPSRHSRVAHLFARLVFAKG